MADQVREAAGSVTLVGSPARYSELGFPVVGDAVADFGPLAGLLAALEHSAVSWNLVVACDMPHLRPEFLSFLLKTASAEDVDVLLPLDRQGLAEPLCAVYARRCRDTIAQAVARGVHKMTHAFAGLRVRELPFSEYAAFDPDGLLFANLNTQADLAGAHRAG